MSKKVFSSVAEVAHKWASQSQESARNSSGSIYFDGPTIYSYGSHFPIASFHGGLVLFTTASYSTSTSQHVNAARSAVNHETTIRVNNPCPTKTKEHRANVAGLLKHARQLAKDWKNSRKYKYQIQNGIMDLMRDVQTYLAHFKLKPLKATRAAIDAFQSFQDTFSTDTSDERKSELLVSFICWLLGLNEAETKLQQAKQKQQAKQRAAEIERQRIEREKSIEQKQSEALPFLTDWRDGKSIGADRMRKIEVLPVALRVRNIDGCIVETSHGARISCEDFQLAYRLWKAGKLEPGTQIDGFRYNRTENETVVIGCHKIAISEIERVAEQLESVTA